MKKLSEVLHLNEKTKFFISAVTAGVLMIAAILIPLAFRNGAEKEETLPTSLEEKMLLFSNYWEHGAEECGLGVEKIENPSAKMKEKCETRMRTMIARGIEDKALSAPTPTGREYITLTDADGRTVNVCRMWLEIKGDWQNWMDACFDADTGELFYLYLSRECVENKSEYERTPESLPTAESLAVHLAEENGWTIRYVAEEDDYSKTVVYSAQADTIVYCITCKAYETISDITIKCQ